MYIITLGDPVVPSQKVGHGVGARRVQVPFDKVLGSLGIYIYNIYIQCKSNISSYVQAGESFTSGSVLLLRAIPTRNSWQSGHALL